MRYSTLTILLLLTAFQLCFSTSTKAQKLLDRKVTLSADHESLKAILKSINEQTKVEFVYSSKFNIEELEVSIKTVQKELKTVLREILIPHNLSFEQLGDNIIITKNNAPLSRVASENATTVEQSDNKVLAKIDVTGMVKDASGEPIPGVSIKLKGAPFSTITDVDGKYKISVPDGNAVLIYSYIGFKSVEMQVGNKEVINVTLLADENPLNEVVVVGYGTQKRVTMTSAVSSVKGDEFKSAPVGNVSNVLGGRVSGVVTRQTSGAPGADQARVFIRGSEVSLILVDGIETQTWQRVNTQEIETISILKDASAVAPYGLKGANGVILITTKRGKSGKMSWNYSADFGIQSPINKPEFMDAYESLAFRNKAFDIDGTPNLKLNATELEKYRSGENRDAYPNTDWVNDYMKNSTINRHHLSLSGGSDMVKAFASLGYFAQGSMLSKDIDYDRLNLRSNVDIAATKTTNISFDVSLIQDQRSWLGTDPTIVVQNLYLTPAFEPNVFSNGLPALLSTGGSVYQEVYGSGEKADQNDMQNIGLTFQQQLPFVKGLSFKAIVNYQRQTKDRKEWTSPYIAYTYDRVNQQFQEKNLFETQKGRLEQEYRRWTNYTTQFYLNYKRNFGKHQLEALSVYERRWGDTKTLIVGNNAFDISIPEFDMGSTDKANQYQQGRSYKTATDGLVGRINYNYNDKYLVELAGRYDRTYKYAPDRRSAVFPSASVGWRISEESFLKGKVSGLDNLKLRANYGRVGNPVGNDFDYLTRYLTSAGYYYGSTPIQGQGLYVAKESNVFLTWETVWKTNLGLDLSMWNGLLDLQFEYFYDKRNDKILAPNADVPIEYGIALADDNAGREIRYGYEFNLANRTKITSDLLIRNSLNFTFSRNKQLELREAPGTLNNPLQRRTGLPDGQIWGYRAQGLFNDAQDVANWPYQGPNTAPGDIKYTDINRDGKIDNQDQVRIGRSTIPEIMYGYNLNAEYKRFTLGLFFQGVANSDFYLGSADRGVRYPFDNLKPRAEHSKSWTPDNPDPNAAFPRLSATKRTQNYESSDFWVVNTSFFRLKSLELGYSFKPDLIKKLSLQNARIFTNLYNVWNIYSDMPKDFDVENQAFSAYPQQFVASFGINITF